MWLDQAPAPELLAQAHAGDARALAELLLRTRPQLRRYAQRHCLVSDVEDAVQEALWVVARRLPALRQLNAFVAWWMQVIKRECRRLGRVALQYDPYDEAAVDAWLAHHSTDELRLDLAAALQSLPAAYLEVLLLRDFEELSLAEIAQRLGLSVAAAKSRLHRARGMTREYLLGQ